MFSASQTLFDLPHRPSLMPAPLPDQESSGTLNSEEWLPAASEQHIQTTSEQFPATSESAIFEQQSLASRIVSIHQQL